MQVTRRMFSAGALAFCLNGCSGPITSARQTSGVPEDLRPVPNAGYDAWVASFQPRARSKGISQSTLDSAFRDTGYLPGVIKRDRNQVEFRRSLEDYLSIAVSDERVSRGRSEFSKHRSTLTALENRFGVDAEIITAIWGLESSFGDRRGNIPVISSTSTLAYDGRRGAFFEEQLVSALRILQNGDVAPNGLVGSWAGAMGHTQFIPTSFETFAVDFNGDGRRDIWSNDPTDALASTAAYLQRNGWARGVRWGNEVTGGSGGGRVIQPQAGGPRFAVTQNFRVLKRYNNSDSYAIAVGHLSDRIAGQGPLKSSFPPDANGLTKDDRVALQKGLTTRGFDTQGTDGVIGPKTEAAIRAYQSSRGLAVTGKPSQELVRSLR